MHISCICCARPDARVSSKIHSLYEYSIRGRGVERCPGGSGAEWGKVFIIRAHGLKQQGLITINMYYNKCWRRRAGGHSCDDTVGLDHMDGGDYSFNLSGRGDLNYCSCSSKREKKFGSTQNQITLSNFSMFWSLASIHLRPEKVLFNFWLNAFRL